MSSLNKPVLVLNKLWQPLQWRPAIRALSILYAHKASAVDNDYYAYNWEDWIKQSIKEGDEVVTSTICDIKIPEVIVLAKWDKVFRKDTRCTKRNIYLRDGYRCQYTGKRYKESEVNIDHIIPTSKGGINDWTNMVVCEKELNRTKGDRTPEQAGLKLIRKPVKPDGGGFSVNPKIKMSELQSKFVKDVK